MASLTYKKLEELYPLAYAELTRLNKLDGRLQPSSRKRLIIACPWSETPQGSLFWSSLKKNTITSINRCKKMQPSLFLPEEQDRSNPLALQILLMNG